MEYSTFQKSRSLNGFGIRSIPLRLSKSFKLSHSPTIYFAFFHSVCEKWINISSVSFVSWHLQYIADFTEHTILKNIETEHKNIS